MRVACVAVPHFLVEVERLRDPSVRGRPVVVGGAPEERKEVLDCSSEAMARGVRPGIPLREALSRCAEAAFVEAHPERYQAVTLAIVAALLELSPIVEPAGPGVIYVSVDGRIHPGEIPPLPLGDGGVDAMEAGLAQTVVAVAEAASGLAVRVGIADGKFAAYVAAVHPPQVGGRVRHEEPRAQDSFLADLSIDDLPVSAKMRRRLRLFGLRTLGNLAPLPKGAVAAQFGLEGAWAWDLAHGIDRTPLVPYCAPATVTERVAFGAPVDALDALLAAVRTLLGRALRRPESRGRVARGIQVLVRLEGGHTWERKVTFREAIRSSERMLAALKHKIEAGVGEMPFTEVELTLLGLCGESALQGSLFTSKRGRQMERVAEAARQLKERYGRPTLAKVVEMEPWSRIPERRFALIDYDP